MAIPHGQTNPELRPMEFLGLERALIVNRLTGDSYPGVVLHLDNDAGRPDDLVSIVLTEEDAELLEARLRDDG